MNETSSILLLSIVGIWLFTSQRGQAFLTVIKGGSSSPKIYDPTNPLPQVGAIGGPMETNPATSPTPATVQLPGTPPAAGS